MVLSANGKKDALAKNVQKEISVGSFERSGHFTELHIKAQRIRGDDGERGPQRPVISLPHTCARQTSARLKHHSRRFS